MNCKICGKPIVLRPSAAERAKQYGGDAATYKWLFPSHAECVVAKRSAESIELMEKLK